MPLRVNIRHLTRQNALLEGQISAAELDLETEHVTREVSLVFQALIILSVSAEGVWHWMKRREQNAKTVT